MEISNYVIYMGGVVFCYNINAEIAQINEGNHMKNQYVGDVGDYGKYSMLRAFSEAGVRVGINWYLTEDDGSNDGKHISYLEKDDMRIYDPVVFDTLKRIVNSGNRSVQAVKDSDMVENALYYDGLLKIQGNPPEKEHFRIHWFNKSMDALAGSNLIFMDPDNGLLDNNDYLAKGADKYIFPNEVKRYYNEGFNVVYYCHKGRRTYTQWDDYKNAMVDRIPDAKPVILTFHKGTQRSYIFLIHSEDFVLYRKVIDGIKIRWRNLFSEEYSKKGDVAGASTGQKITFTKSDGTVITLESRADGQVQMRSSVRPNEYMVQPVDLFCRLLGY